MKNFQFQKYYDNVNGNPRSLSNEVKRDKAVYEELEKYLKENNLSFGEFFYCGLYKKKKPLCICGKELGFKSFTKGFYKNCSSICAGKNKETLSKRKKTSLKKYGVENIMKLDSISEESSKLQRNKSLKTYKENLQELFILSDKECKEYLLLEKESEDQWTFICKKCKNVFKDKLYKKGNKRSFNYQIPRCLKCNPLKEKHLQKEIYNYLLENKQSSTYDNKSILNNKELDLYIADKSLAIEFNGLMYHSFWSFDHSIFNNKEQESLRKKEHLIKTELCEEKNINLLHIFENEWLDPTKQDIWKSIISSKIGKNTRIYARKTILDTDIPSKESKSFLEENHLQGNIAGSIRIGLRNKEGDLLCLMTFWKSRYGWKYNYELLRFASKKYITITGGASKLFSYFKKNTLEDWESIVSYADRRHSNWNLYSALGFTFSHKTQPNYFYFKHKEYILYSRVSFQKHKLKEKLESFDPNLTETENMYNNSYRKIFDCGNKVYIYSKD